jgi:ribosomal protein S18 acetylase RimI-like enzyme
MSSDAHSCLFNFTKIRVNILIRSGTTDDAARVAELLIDTRQQFMPYAPSPHSAASIHAWVATVLMPSGAVVLAQIDAQVLGMMATETQDGYSWITQMAVDPKNVGNGIGSALLAHAIATLRRPIRLYTFAQNSGARRFYERAGFTAIAFSSGETNEEKCPDVLYELR